VTGYIEVLLRFNSHYPRLAILLLLILFSVSGWSQSTPYLHYSVGEGLPSSEVYNIFQDSKGFVWFATDNGVVRYDGRDMDVFQTDEGLSDPVVFQFIEDSKRRLWFRSFSGKLSYFFNEKIYSFPYNDSLSFLCRKNYMESLFVDSKNQIWFGNGTDILKIDSIGHFEKIGIGNDINQWKIKIVEDELVYAYKGPLANSVRIENNLSSFPRSNTEVSPRKVCTLQWKGEKYFSLGTWIYQIVGDSTKPVFHGPDQIISLSVDLSNNLWIGYMQTTLQCYSDFNKVLNFNFPFLKSKSVTGLLQDNQHGYWISTLQDGVYYIPEISFLAESVDMDSKITATLSSKNNTTLIGDDQGRVLLIDSLKSKKNEIALGKFTILSLILSSKDQYWVATSKNTFILDTSLKILREIPRSFSQFSEDPDGFMWGVSGVYIYKLNASGDVLEMFGVDKASRSIYATSEYIFLFGRTGLQLFDHDFKEILLPRYFENFKISKVAALNDSLFLMGTLGNGFLIVNRKEWSYKEYSLREKFNANNIYAQARVGERIWLGTEKGVAVANIKDIVMNDPTFFFITKRNGLINDKVNHLTCSNQSVWVYSEKSICFIPEKLDAQSSPRFYLQSVLVNDQSYALRNGSVLASSQNDVQVNFKLLDFKNQNNFVRYRLSNESPWNYTEERFLKFYSLGPGNYSFRLQYSNDNSHWTEALSINFVIQPSWWKAWYFQLFGASLIIFFGMIFYLRRISRIREKHRYLRIIHEQQKQIIEDELETLDKERGRIAKELHDSVGANLSAIKMTVRRLFKKHDEHGADLVEEELQNTIREIRNIIYQLEPSELSKYGFIVTLRNYVGKIQKNIDAEIDIQAIGAEINELNISLTAFRIVQELITNSLKHSRANKIRIFVSSPNNILNIRYEDNGVGFKLESIVRGSGLTNIESRVQAARGALKFESKEFGVSYTIDLPLGGSEADHL
jgi:signal transduction histidine kinase